MERPFSVLPPAMWWLLFGCLSTVFLGSYGWLLGVEIGICLILIQAGVEEDIDALNGSLGPAVVIATVGVLAPFILCSLIIYPAYGLLSALAVGATMTATSITLSRESLVSCGMIQSPLAKVVVTAAVVDDVMGILVLVVLLPWIANTGAGLVPVVLTVAMTGLVFLRIRGHFLSTKLAGWFLGLPERYVAGVRAQQCGFALAAVLWLLGAVAVAHFLHIEIILAVFYAGLVIEHPQSVYVKDLEHVFQRILHTVPLGKGFTLGVYAVTFWLVGSQVDILTLLESKVMLFGLLVTVAGVAGKIFSGQALRLFTPLNSYANRRAVGWGMVPRGEVGIAVTAMWAAYFPSELVAIALMGVLTSTLVGGLRVPKVFTQLQHA